MHARLIIVAVLLGGCAGAAGVPTVNDAYIWPVEGQGADRTGQDKADCYRIAQGLTADEALAAGSKAGGSALVDGGLVLGAAGAFGAGAVAYEMELARRYPPDLGKYGACLTARGYSVDWPRGKQP